MCACLMTVFRPLWLPSHTAPNAHDRKFENPELQVQLTDLRDSCNAATGHELIGFVEIKKAIITAAGKSQRTLPLQTLVDRDGSTKTALKILIDEILATGVEELCVVICPGDQPAYEAAAGGKAGRLHFVEQTTPRGYGHAVFCAREFVGGEPFLLLVGDHLYVSGGLKRCAEQLATIAAAENCSGARKANPYRSRTEIDRARPARRTLPVLLWNARLHANRHGAVD